MRRSRKPLVRLDRARGFESPPLRLLQGFLRAAKTVKAEALEAKYRLCPPFANGITAGGRAGSRRRTCQDSLCLHSTFMRSSTRTVMKPGASPLILRIG